MKLSKEQRTILKAITRLNEEVWFTSNEIGVSSNDKSQIVYWAWGENLANDFGIANLNKFLSIIELYADPTIVVSPSNLKITEGTKETKYTNTKQSNIMVPPDKTTLFSSKLTAVLDSFTMSKTMITDIQNHSAILKSSHIVIEDKKITATDVKNSASNESNFDIVPTNNIPKHVFRAAQFQTIIQDDYEADLYDKVLVLKGKANLLTYILVSSKV